MPTRWRFFYSDGTEGGGLTPRHTGGGGGSHVDASVQARLLHQRPRLRGHRRVVPLDRPTLCGSFLCGGGFVWTSRV
eukprot:6626813-Pyramimonas_sp.AAC.1